MKQKKHNHLKHGLFVILLLICTVSLYAQDSIQINNNNDYQHLIDISGKVVDAATGVPLVGARVQTVDKKYSALTKEDGVFQIKLPSAQLMIVVTAPDFALREYSLQGRTEKIEVALFSPVFSNYYENVLSPLGEERRIATTGAQSSVINAGNMSGLDVSSVIQAKLGGDMRVITHSGAPAIGASMYVRGLNSLNANAQPLIVVDGTIWDRPLNKTSVHQGYTIDPLANLDINDIETITLLKDGTSLYGSKGANGVLLIKTHRGRDLATRVTFSANVGLNTRPDALPMMNAEQYRTYASDMLQGAYNAGIYIDRTFLDDNPNSFHYNKYHGNTDWIRNVYRNSLTHNYHIGVNGGDEIALYNLSVGYAHAESTMEENNFSRLNTRFNTDINLSTIFKISFDLSYSQTDRNLLDDGIAEDMTLGPVTSPGFLAYIKAPFLSPYKHTNQGTYTSKLEDYDFLNIGNPVAAIKIGEGSSQHNRFNVSTVPRLHFTDNLTLKTHFSYSYVNLSEHYYRPLQGFAPFRTLWSTLENQVKTQFVKQQSIYSNTTLDWHKSFGLHHMNLTGGFLYMTDLFRGDFASGYNTGSDHSKEMSKNLKNRTTGGYDDSWKTINWYLNANYNYLGKYYLNASVSLDASSRFGDDADSEFKMFGVNYAMFPSINAAWLVSSERFMSNLPVISLMKLRIGYGLSGNDGIDNNASMTYFGAIKYLYKATGLQLENIGNPKIQWETTKKLNIGADLNLFDDRLLLSADYFNNQTDNLLTLKNHKYVTGLESYWDNGGKMENKGYELSAKGKILNMRDFQWELGASIAHYNSKIKALPDGDYSTILYGGEIRTMIGKSPGLFYGYKTNGIYKTTAEADNVENGGGLSVVANTGALMPLAAGDVRFVDIHKDGIINEKDKTIIGDPNPDFTGTMTSTFKYKRFVLNALFTYSYGNDSYNYQRRLLESGSSFYNQTSGMIGRWQVEGQQAILPKAVYGDPMDNNRFSDRWIEDGSYFRLKNLSLSYNVPIQSRFFQGITIWTSATNLFTITKYLGTDPEFSINNSILYQGIDAGLISQSRSYYLGIKVNL